MADPEIKSTNGSPPPEQGTDQGESTPPSPLRVVFAIVGETFSPRFVLAWTELLWSLQRKQVDVSMRITQPMHRTWQTVLGYNDLGEGSLFDKQPYDVAILVGPDSIPTTHNVLKLLDSPHEVTACPCSDGCNVLAAEKKGDEGIPLERWQAILKENGGEGYLPVHATALACVAFKKGVLEKLHPPHIFTAPPIVSPATALCTNLANQGFTLYLDLTSPVPVQVLAVV